MNNPPAFPVFPETSGGHAAAFQGMTLRDYFAAKAMNAFLSRDGGTYEQDADCAYKMADAMLKAREA
jgi:hypothetical protein